MNYIDIIKFVMLTSLLVVMGLFLNDGGKIVKADIADNKAQVTRPLYLKLGKLNQITEPEISLKFVGDIMLDRGVKNRVLEHGEGDYSFLFNQIQEELASDILFGNLEGPISTNGTKDPKKFTFRFPPKTKHSLKNAGFDVLSLANNHIFDYGRSPACDTVNHLKEVHITPIGVTCLLSEGYDPGIFDFGKTRIAYQAFTEFYRGANATDTKPGLAPYDDMESVISTIHSMYNPDITIISLHWGIEYEPKSRTYQQEIARSLIDHGVDIIIGHHPHVSQEVEQYNNGLIFYSLGNFIFDQSWSEETMKGSLAEVTLKGKKIESATLREVKLNNMFQPALTGKEEKIIGVE